MNSPALVDLIFVLSSLGFLIYGYKKGFLFSILGLLAFIVTLTLGYLLYPLFGKALFERTGFSYLTANILAFTLLSLPLFFLLRMVASRLTQQMFAAFFGVLINHRRADKLLGAFFTFVIGASFASLIGLAVLNLPIEFDRGPVYASYWGRKIIPLASSLDSGINVTLGRSSQTNVLSYLVPQNETFTDPNRIYSRLDPAGTLRSPFGASPTKVPTSAGQPVRTPTPPIVWGTGPDYSRGKTIDEILGYQEFDVETERQKLIDLVNESRRIEGLRELVEDELLNKLAQDHAEDMKANNYVSHFDLAGIDNEERATAAGLVYFDERENISLAANAESAHASEMAAPGHRRSIMIPQMQKIGAAVVEDFRGLNIFVKELSTTEVFDRGPQSD